MISIAILVVGKPSALYDDTNPDWAPSVQLGYDFAVPDSDRYDRRKQRSRVSEEHSQSIETATESTESGPTELETACQSALEPLPSNCEECQAENELTTDERKEFLRLKKENEVLKLEVEKLRSESTFTEEFLSNEKNQGTLKFFTG